MELSTLRIIGDIKTGQFKKTVADYLLDDDYDDKKEFFEGMAKIPLKLICTELIRGYSDLSEEDKETFNKVIIPFCQCQGKGRLTNTTIDRISHMKHENDIRVYLIEYGEEGYQYFRKNGEWD